MQCSYVTHNLSLLRNLLLLLLLLLWLFSNLKTRETLNFKNTYDYFYLKYLILDMEWYLVNDCFKKTFTYKTTTFCFTRSGRALTSADKVKLLSLTDLQIQKKTLYM